MWVIRAPALYLPSLWYVLPHSVFMCVHILRVGQTQTLSSLTVTPCACLLWTARWRTRLVWWRWRQRTTSNLSAVACAPEAVILFTMPALVEHLCGMAVGARRFSNVVPLSLQGCWGPGKSVWRELTIQTACQHGRYSQAKQEWHFQIITMEIFSYTCTYAHLYTYDLVCCCFFVCFFYSS